jgi:hypothetical protein
MERRPEVYCTYFDHNYLRKGLLLYSSLRRNSKPRGMTMVVLALSERCEKILKTLQLPNLEVIPLRRLEEREPRLLEAKADRRLVEYFFTLTPWVITLTLEAIPSARRVTYVDSDLYFFSNIEPIWQEAHQHPMTFVEHRFSPGYADKIIFGKYNVGWNTFDRSSSAVMALEWWRERCLEWCYDRVEGEKFADQGYLTTLADKFSGVHSLQYPGANLAQYNIGNYNLEIVNSGPTANGLPVIYWHMHSVIENDDGSFKAAMSPDLSNNPVVNWAYTFYIDQLKQLTEKLKRRGLPIDRGNARYPNL